MRMRYTFVAMVVILGVALVACAPSSAPGSSLSPLGTPSSEGTLMAPGGLDTTPSTSDMTPSAGTTPSGGTPSAELTPGIPQTGGTVPAKIRINQQGANGPYLVDDTGMALYAFTNDTADTSTCTGSCAQTWRPVTTGGAPEGDTGVDATMLGTLKRDDGSTQVTYNHMPLYYYANDTAAGDTKGQGLNSKWYLVSPDGKMIEK